MTLAFCEVCYHVHRLLYARINLDIPAAGTPVALCFQSQAANRMLAQRRAD
jgi:hypothetical protein